MMLTKLSLKAIPSGSLLKTLHSFLFSQLDPCAAAVPGIIHDIIHPNRERVPLCLFVIQLVFSRSAVSHCTDSYISILIPITGKKGESKMIGSI